MPAEETIGRAHVESLLDQALGSRLTVVCAGPGWGKTTAVARWLSTGPWSGRPAAWLTAHPGADDPATFWGALVDALRQTGAVPDDHPLAALSGAAGVGPEVLASLLRGLESLPTDVLLVLDDLHEVSNPHVIETLSTMVQRATRVRLIALTRRVLPLPHHQLRLTGGLTEIVALDLALDRAEVIELARRQGVAVSPEQAADLLARTEGWPVGVRLALLRAARHGPGSLASFTGSEHGVAGYLLAEVLERNSPQMRDFLLRTSVAPRVCADLAESIVPATPAQQVLEQLESRNEFVTALGLDRVWYRYHPLLRDLLLHSMRRDDPGALRSAHQAAAGWWSTHADPVQALRHATEAEDWSLFEEIFVQAAGASLVGPGREALGTCLRTVPFDALPDSVESHLMRAGLALVDGRGGAVTHHCAAAQASVRSGAAVPPPAALALLELLTLAGRRFSGDSAGALEAGHHAVAVLDACDPFPAQPDYRLVATHNLGVGHLWEADFDAACRCFTEVLDWGPGGADLAHFGAQSYLALARAARGELGTAQTDAGSALAAAASRGWLSLMHARPAHLASAQLHLLHGDWDLADTARAFALAADRGGSEPPSLLWLQCLQAEIAASRGRIREGQHAMHAARLSELAFDPPDFLVDVVDHALTEVALMTPGAGVRWGERPKPRAATAMRGSCEARLLLARGDRSGAHRLASQVAEQYQAGQAESLPDLVALIDAYLVIAAVDDDNWNSDASLAALESALDLARPHRIARPFLMTRSPRTAALLQHVADRQPDPFAAHLGCRLAGLGQAGRQPGRRMPTLTQRELAMLAALPSMKSNAQIADDFYVSVNTVKAHLKGLYRKLDVSSRREAVERARDLGVLR